MSIERQGFVSAAPAEPVVAVFDTMTMALRAVSELTAADLADIWLGVVRGETPAGETVVARAGEDEQLLYRVLSERGSADDVARRFDGILPPGTAVMSVRAHAKLEHAVSIIELVGGHIDHL